MPVSSPTAGGLSSAMLQATSADASAEGAEGATGTFPYNYVELLSVDEAGGAAGDSSVE